jgi:hypothetical protein
MNCSRVTSRHLDSPTGPRAENRSPAIAGDTKASLAFWLLKGLRLFLEPLKNALGVGHDVQPCFDIPPRALSVFVCTRQFLTEDITLIVETHERRVVGWRTMLQWTMLQFT